MSCAAALAFGMPRSVVEWQSMSPQQVVWVKIRYFWIYVPDLNDSDLDFFPPNVHPDWLLADTNPRCHVPHHLHLGCLEIW